MRDKVSHHGVAESDIDGGGCDKGGHLLEKPVTKTEALNPLPFDAPISAHDGGQWPYCERMKWVPAAP